MDWLQLVRTAVIMRGESSEGQHYTRRYTLLVLEIIIMFKNDVEDIVPLHG